MSKKKAKSKPAARLPRTVRELTDLWKELEHITADTGIKMDALYSMRHRNRVEAAHWQPLVTSARKRKLSGVTLELLAGIHAKKPAKKAA